MTGELLGGRYSILDTIGEGGMATVYRATDAFLQRTVAIKVLRPQYASDAEFRERFRREAQSAAALSHPNIVNVYDVGREGGSNYIVMECVDGRTLNDIIVSEGRLSADRTADYGTQILDALDHAHANGVIHRDIKPHNILITRDGRVKVTDFGIARAVSASALTETGRVIGTVNYTSPEQARGAPATAESDIYSLGVVMYEMLTGKLPFAGDTPVAVALKHVQEEPAPISLLNPAVPPEFERVVMRALAKNPEDRWRTARSFKHAIARARQEIADGGQRAPLPAVGTEREVPPARQLHDEHNITRPFEKTGEAFEVQRDDPKRSRRQPAPEGARSRRLRIWATVVVFMLLMAGAVFGALHAFREWIQVEEVAVPELVGLTLPEAEGVVRRNRLALDASVKRYDDKVEYNRIISQDPAPGVKRKVHSVVRAVVSLGPEMVTVPDLFNKTEREARFELEGLNIALGEKTDGYHEEVQPGRIIEQKPEAGMYVSKGSRIDVVISVGPPPPPPEVPLVIGMTLEKATETLSALGLAVGEVKTRFSILYQEGTVVDQSPAPYVQAEPGTTVDLVVAERNREGDGSTSYLGSRRFAVTYTVPPGPSMQEIVIKVIDTYGERTSYGPRSHSPGDNIAHVVEVFGPGKIEVWVDGRPVRADDV
ncbi:MAG: Stk1 family PASTA domain-containing Ser/Thr kinase [Bacillota bacterium]